MASRIVILNNAQFQCMFFDFEIKNDTFKVHKIYSSSYCIILIFNNYVSWKYCKLQIFVKAISCLLLQNLFFCCNSSTLSSKCWSVQCGLLSLLCRLQCVTVHYIPVVCDQATYEILQQHHTSQRQSLYMPNGSCEVKQHNWFSFIFFEIFQFCLYLE